MQSTIDHSPANQGNWFEAAVDAVRARSRVPRATYRLQFNPGFTFEDARRLIPYLDALGISDVYASPLLAPCAGSTHGYDICDHHQLNPALGTPEDFARFTDELRQHGLGLVFDVVPNHMGISDEGNAWWSDVLEDGPISPYAPYFDIDWHPLKVESQLENKVLLPILGDQYGKVLTRGELRLTYANGAFFITYFDRRFPVNPRSYADLLAGHRDEVVAELGAEHPDAIELESIVTAIKHLPLETEVEPERIAERQREKTVIKRRLARVVDASPVIRRALDETVRDYNGTPGDVHSFDQLDGLLDEQNYRLAFWRVAAEEINYRRFFDINELAAIRMERPEVFAETHQLILQLVSEGKVTGLRIDHADGLWDPVGYLRDLQRAAFLALARPWLDQHFGSDGEARAEAETDLMRHYDAEIARNPESPLGCSIYVVVEKILGAREVLPDTWPVDGTTGYDFANQVNGLFVDSRNQKAFTDLYATFTHRDVAYADLVNSTKKMIMLSSLPSEVNELAFQLKRMARQSRWYRDLTLNSLTFALREVIASLPIYRTYLTEASQTIDRHDQAAIEAAIADARRRNPRTAAAVFDFLRAVLLQDYPEDATDAIRDEWTRFVLRFQQLTSPVVAKGIEDTAFYIYNRLLSLNEVGGNPQAFGLSPANFHRLNLQRLAHWPHAMLAASTHDSKRSADARARLDVLSEIPAAFRHTLTQWARLNRAKKSLVHGTLAPDRNDEYLLYQTLLGAWPLGELDAEKRQDFQERIQAYLQKAIKEAKVHTSWVNPNAEYDEAVQKLVAAILTGPKSALFLESFQPLQRLVAYFGMLNSLAQTLLQLTAPGVPDTYQGTELWDFSLVDPDNRRPVDYALRKRYLDELRRRMEEGVVGGVKTVVGAASTVGAAASRVASPRGAPSGPLSTYQRGRGGTEPSHALLSRSTLNAGAPEGIVPPLHAAVDRAPEGAPRGEATQATASLVPLVTNLLDHWQDGRVKLYLIYQTLTARREQPEVFGEGDYRPLEVVGPAREHAIGFIRQAGDRAFLTLVPRLVATLMKEEPALPLGDEVWGETAVELPADLAVASWRNRFTGETIRPIEAEGKAILPLGAVLRSFPVALLEKV